MVRFLIDAQLPPLLCRWLAEQGHDAVHVQELGMAGADDPDIWSTAIKDSRVLLTKDEDFAIMRQRSADGPVVCWLRVGNVTNPTLLQWLAPRFPQMCDAISASEQLIELR